MKIQSVLKEPLLHFLLIGLLLFLVYGKVAPPSDEGNRVTVDKAIIAGLASQFQATWSRPPTPEELTGLIDGYVRDAILYREGLALGLDKDDPIIKRRVRQKLEVIVEEEGKTSAPTDAELEAYLRANAEKFRLPSVLTFDQVLFNPADYGDKLDATLSTAMAALKSGAAPESQGHGSLLPVHFDKQPIDRVARDFGGDFGKALEPAPVGEWFGPIRSGFGVHLVRITEKKQGYLPSLHEARRAVIREWENDRRKSALEANYARMRKDYNVVIEGESTETTSR